MKKQLSLISAVCLAAALLSSCADSNGTDAAALVRDIPTVQYFIDEAVTDSDIQLIVEAGVQAPSAMNSQPWHFSVVTDVAVLQQMAGGMGGGMGGFPGGAPTEREMPTMPEGVEMPNGGTPPTGEGFPSGGTPPTGEGFPSGGTPPTGEGFPSGGSGFPGGSGGAFSGAAKAGIADAPLAIIISAKAGSEFDAGLACQNMSVEAQLLGYGTKIISSTTMVLNGEKQAEYKSLLGIPEDMSAVAVLLVGMEDKTAAADASASATERNPLDNTVTYVKGN